MLPTPLDQDDGVQAGPPTRYRVELITAESEASRFVRHRRLIRFPQLTMPLLAAHTPDHWEVSHTDEIVQRVDFEKRVDLVGITANTPAAPHAYELASEFRRRGVAVVIGGPHATLMPDEVARHADAVVLGEGEVVWPQLLADFERGGLKRTYNSCTLPDLKNMPAPRWDLIRGRAYGKGVTIATRGCPFACEYCTIPQMYQRRMRYRPVGQAEGRILTRDWSKYNGKKDVVFQPALMSPHELLMGMEWAARQFYSIPAIIERMARSRTGLWWNVARNLGYHLALRNFGDVGCNPEGRERFSSARSPEGARLRARPRPAPALGAR